MRAVGIIDLVLFAGFEIFMTIGVLAGEGESDDAAVFLGVTAVFLLFLFLGVFLVRYARRRLVVEGQQLSYLPTFGRARIFTFGDIAGMRISPDGRRLLGRDGKTLARFEDNQENGVQLLRLLRSHGIGLTM